MPSKYELVDRKNEINLLTDCWNDAKEGHGSVVMIYGEAGIGKTQLVEDFVKNIKDELIYLHGECIDTRVIPYLPLIMALSDYFDRVERDKLEKIRSILIENAEVILNLIPVIGNISPIIAKILRDWDYSKLRKISEFDETGEIILIRKWIKLLEELSKNQQMIIFVDDIHWADSATLNLIRDLSRRISDKSILFICTYRIEYVNEYSPDDIFNKTIMDMRIKRLCNEIRLKGIRRDKIPDTVRYFLGKAKIGEEHYNFIYERTEGNPFAVRELLSYLIEEGHMKEEFGIWVFSGAIKGLVVPSTIREMVLKRIAKLPEEFREILEFASVIGFEFKSKELGAVFDYEERVLLNHLRKIEQVFHLIKDMIYKHQFYHINIRDVLYSQLPPQLCQAYHKAIAEYLEQNVKDDSIVFVLAYHYLHAREWRKALDCSTKAGDKARSVFSYHDAEKYYEQAIDIIQKEIVPTDEIIKKSYEVYFNLGFVRRYIGDFESAEILFEKCIEQLENTEKIIPLAMNCTILADVLQNQGKYWKSYELLHRAIKIFEKNLQLLSNEEKKLYGYALNRLGIYYKQTDCLEKAKKIFEKSKELGYETKFDSLIASCLANIGAIEKRLGNYDETFEYWKKSLEIARDTNDYYRISHYLLDLGYICLLRRENKIAEEYIRDGKERAVENEFWEEICRSYLTEGNLYFINNQVERALQLYVEAEKIARKYGIKRLLWQIINNIGNCYFDDFGKAYSCYRKSIDMIVDMADEIETEKEKEGFTRHHIGPFKSMISLCFHFGNIEKAEEAAMLSGLHDIDEFFEDIRTHGFNRDIDKDDNFRGFYIMMG